MAVKIIGTTSGQELETDSASKAARVTLYNSSGAELTSLSVKQVSARTSPLIYSYTMIDLAGQTAAYVFWALSNPAASSKRIALIEVSFQVYSVAAAATKNSWSLVHCTAEASGGSDDSANIHRILSTQAAPVSVVRITAPTITAGKPIKAFAAGGVITAAGIYGVPEILYKPETEDAQSIILPGEGLALRQTVAGDADQTYCFRVVWMEYTP